MHKALQAQIEYYFSDENFLRDRFLRNQRDPQRYVTLGTLAKFKKIALHFPNSNETSLNARAKELAKALSGSETLELNEDSTRIRRIVPLEEEEEKVWDRETLHTLAEECLAELDADEVPFRLRTLVQKVCAVMALIMSADYMNSRDHFYLRNLLLNVTARVKYLQDLNEADECVQLLQYIRIAAITCKSKGQSKLINGRSFYHSPLLPH